MCLVILAFMNFGGACRDNSDALSTPSVGHNEQSAGCPHAECDVPLFMRIRFVIGNGDGIWIVKHRDGFWHTNTVFPKVDSGFAVLIPLETHVVLVYRPNVHTSRKNRSRGLVSPLRADAIVLTSAMKPVSIAQAFEGIRGYWSPKVIGRVNDQYVKAAKLKGQLAWHMHENEDELFQVIQGELVIQLEGDREVTLRAGEFFVVPRGVRHNPVAENECWILLIETLTTKHTGDVETPLTKTIEQQLGRTNVNAE